MTEDIINQISSGVVSVINEELGRKLALLITIPKDIPWEEYKKELDAVADGSQEMLFRLSGHPKKVGPGDRCYVCHRGYIIGWMKITGIEDKPLGFTCTTTGIKWPPGTYLKRSGEFHYLKAKVPTPGFRGFKYIDII